MTPEELLRVLADPERLAVAGALATRRRTASELAEHLELPIDRVRRHLGRLTTSGLVATDPDRRTYRLLAQTLRNAAREVGPDRGPGLALGAVFEGEEEVLRHYFRQGRLIEIPAKRAKRNIVLGRLALEFEIGVRYSEREVNEALKRFHDDYASLRRYLVDEEFLSRERGEYWRSGGPVDV
ncbi:MAG: DUF2087 domain-containing protein [Actinomycetota bacterium]